MSSTSQPYLQLQSVQAVYGAAIHALTDVSIEVHQGHIVALLGRNGSGKSTTLKAISNLLSSSNGKVTQGKILWQGREIQHFDPIHLAQQGLVQVLEGRHVFPQLSVEENLLTGGFLRKPSRAALKQLLEQTYEWFPRLRERRHSKAGLTSGGEQQMVAIGRALMTQPQLVLLDEPSMGLAPKIVEEIFDIIRHLSQTQNLTFLLAEQNANLTLRYAQSAYVLENGSITLQGRAAELRARADIQNFYLGQSTANVAA